MAMKVHLLLLLIVNICCVQGHTLFDVLEAEAVLKSKARLAFTTDQHFASKIETLHSMISDRTSDARQSTHPFIVRINDDCRRDCSKRYLQHFTSKRLVPLSKKFFLITSSATEMESFATDNPDVVKYHFPMIPEMKVDAAVADVARSSNCEIAQSAIHSRHSDRHKTEPAVQSSNAASFKITITPLGLKDINDFLKFTRESSKTSAPFSYHYAKQQRMGEKQYLEITLANCAQTADVVNMFAHRREVMWIERIYPAHSHNRWANGICDTADAASKPLETNSDANFTGRGDIIGVIDTGIDMKNCYFRDPDVATPYVWADVATNTTPNFAHRKVVQYYMHTKGSQQTDKYDDYTGHGTHVAGIVAGRAVQRYGDYKTYEGMASDAKVAFFDIGDEESSRPGRSLILPANLNTGMFAIMKLSGARIFTNSWGTSSNSYDSMAVDVDTFMWENPDSLVLFSAGNSGANGGYSINSPGTCKNAATVGATLNDHDAWLAYELETDEAYGIEAVAGFSSQGPTNDNRLKPDILAPGFWTTSALGAYNSTKDFCQVIALRGTSMACPTAASFALKIRRYFLDGFYPGGTRDESASFTPSGALLKGMLVHSGQKMKYKVGTIDHFVSDTSATYPSNTQGYGRIQMNKVLNFAASTQNPLNLFVIGAVEPSSPHYREFTAAGQDESFFFVSSTASNRSPFRVTLSYTDFPGNALANNDRNGEALQNVLTVEVTSNLNSLVTTPYQVSGTFRSNVQVIDISSLPGVTYTVTVRCTDLEQGPQPYALIVTGVTTYLEDGDSGTLTYDIPSDTFTADRGAMKYILAQALVTAVLMYLVYYVRKVTRQHADMMLDPEAYDEYGEYYDDAGGNSAVSKKGMFAKIRSIRSNHHKAQQRRSQQAADSEGYYE